MNCKTNAIGIAADNLTWGPGAGLILIHNISFAVEPGERLAIIGPNGAGKSTLLRCLYRAARPSAGAVRLGGQDIWAMKARETAQNIAVVLQEMPADFPFSVRDVVLMGRIPRRQGLMGWTAQDREMTAHALEHLELTDLAARQFATLSGGEKQRVLVARALAQEPRLIILDEPTNHLDIRHQLEILDLLKGLGPTIVTTLHDINLTADFATRVAVMNRGRLTSFGAPEDVLTADVISPAFGIDAEAQRGEDGRPSRFIFKLQSQTGGFAP